MSSPEEDRLLKLLYLVDAFFPPLVFIRPRRPIATSIAVVFIPRILSISISSSLYFESFSVTFKDVFFGGQTCQWADKFSLSCPLILFIVIIIIIIVIIIIIIM